MTVLICNYKRKGTVMKLPKQSDVKDCRNPINAEYHIVTTRVRTSGVRRMYFFSVVHWIAIIPVSTVISPHCFWKKHIHLILTAFLRTGNFPREDIVEVHWFCCNSVPQSCSLYSCAEIQLYVRNWGNKQGEVDKTSFCTSLKHTWNEGPSVSAPKWGKWGTNQLLQAEKTTLNQYWGAVSGNTLSFTNFSILPKAAL